MPCFGRKPQKNLEGFLFPATYDFLTGTTSKRLVLTQIQTFCQRWRTVNFAYAHSKNLTNYDILRIASMVEAEAGVPGDRAKIAAVIYNRLRDRMPLGIDATLRYGLHIPPTQSITEVEKNSDNPYNTGKVYGLPPTPIGNPGLASIEAAAHPANVPYLYFVRDPRDKAEQVLRHHRCLRPVPLDPRLRAAPVTTRVALLGHPVSHSLSPRMQNAAFEAAGLDWQYSALDVEDPVAAVAELKADGFAGANVTIPHKQAVVAACDEADGDAVNTLLFRDGRVIGINTDVEILAGIRAHHACLIGAGGAAATLRPALPPDTRVFSRRGDWPPDATGCDLIVNATPVRDELLVTPVAGQTVVELAYSPDGADTALVAAARAAGCEVVDGLEALVRQGARSFELWTGVAAPVEVMRNAVRGAP